MFNACFGRICQFVSRIRFELRENSKIFRHLESSGYQFSMPRSICDLGWVVLLGLKCSVCFSDSFFAGKTSNVKFYRVCEGIVANFTFEF